MDFFQQIDNIALLEPAAHFELFRSISIAEAIENEFTAANIQILTEFGIPSSAIRKILDRYGHHLKGLTEDQVVAAIIRNRELINRCLSVYEIEALERCL